MRTLLKIVGSSTLMTLLTIVLTLGSSTEALAQSTPLAVRNSTPCTIWVQGQTGLGLTAGCTTGWVMVPPGSSVALPVCSGPAYSWYHLHYSNCAPGATCPTPVGTTNSSVAACGMPTVIIPNCTGSMPFTPVWTGTNMVTF